MKGKAAGGDLVTDTRVGEPAPDPQPPGPLLGVTPRQALPPAHGCRGQMRQEVFLEALPGDLSIVME